MALVEVTCNNITLKNEHKAKILNNISVQFKPGTVTAIIGPLGSGRTSLLNSIVGRIPKNFHLNGDILVNGHPRNPKSWPKIVAYVERKFQAYENQTVYETIKFAAISKLPEDDDINEKVDETLVILGLFSAKNTTIELLNYSERIRVYIGVEFIENPTVWLLDEPISELNGFDSIHILEILEHLAKMKKTIVVTIHEPSYELFKYFDSIILITLGVVVYDGPVLGCFEFYRNAGFTPPLDKHNCAFFLNLISLNQRSRETLQNSLTNIKKLKDAWDEIATPSTLTIRDHIPVTKTEDRLKF